MNTGEKQFHSDRILAESIVTMDSLGDRFYRQEMGYTDFIGIKDSDFEKESDNLEWGVDVVLLKSHNNGDFTFAYRVSNPMENGEWAIGDSQDVIDGFEAITDAWVEFRYTEHE